ncbi:MAG: MaoC/PaaZ C-terminal domain-containing protein [Acidimicrobiales bacterium]
MTSTSIAPFEEVIEADAALAFAEVVGEDAGRCARDGVAPLFFPARLLVSALADGLAHADLFHDATGILHVDQSMTFLQSLHLGETARAESHIESMTDLGFGIGIEIAMSISGANGPAVQSRSTIQIRGPRTVGVVHRSSGQHFSPGAVLATVRQHLAADLAERYADVSGDRNPVHLDDDVARALGLPGRIVQGLCTMAITATSVMDTMCGGDPSRVEHMHVRFARPVQPGADLTISVRESSTAGVFPLTVSVDGRRVFRDAFAVLRGAFGQSQLVQG